MKHTPGPWLVGNYDDGIVFGGDAYAIARMIEPIDRPNAKKRSDANATLIAAAPELLSALVDAVELIEIMSPIEGDTLRHARDAIAKAVGHNAELRGERLRESSSNDGLGGNFTTEK